MTLRFTSQSISPSTGWIQTVILKTENYKKMPKNLVIISKIKDTNTFLKIDLKND